MLAHIHGMHRNRRVHMIRRTDQHRIDFGLIVEHLTVVTIGLGLVSKRCGKFLLQRVSEAAIIHITNGIDIFMGDALDVRAPLAASTDGRDVQLVTGGNVIFTT